MNWFNIFLWIMIAIAAIVFVSLYFVKAGYGIFRNNKWGKSINNKIAWILMEAPICLTMFVFWALSERKFQITPLIIFIIFEIHYVQRTFIFPLLLKGKSKMPLAVMFMGIFFNFANAVMQGYWLFFLAPEDKYTAKWLTTPQFIGGTILFFIGWIINLDSDRRIRNLRQPGDTNHYLPHGGMFNFVTSANYFGELLEWAGFAILTWSMPGLVFFIWTFANLVPRADAIHKKYRSEFAEQMKNKKLKRIFPFIY